MSKFLVLAVEGSYPPREMTWLREALLAAGAEYFQAQNKMVLGDLEVRFIKTRLGYEVAGLVPQAVVFAEGVKPKKEFRAYLQALVRRLP